MVIAPKADPSDVDPPTIPAATVKQVEAVDGVDQAIGQVFAIAAILRPTGCP